MFSQSQIRDLLLSILPFFLISLFLVTRRSLLWIVLGYSTQALIWYAVLFFFFRFLFSSILTDRFHTPIDVPENITRWILPGCVLIPLCLTLGTYLSYQIGWTGGLWVALACNLVIFVTSYSYGIKFRSQLDAIQDLSHPYTNTEGWTIVVSRRFNIPVLEEQYQTQILPILQREGIVMECCFAEEEAKSLDFWINRMLIMFEIADIHILIEHEPSQATLIEQFLSDLIAYQGRKIATFYTFGEETQFTPIRPSPFIVKIKDYRCKSGFYPYTYGREAQLFLPLGSSNSEFSYELKHYFDEIKRRIIWMISISRWSKVYKTQEVREIYEERRKLAELFSRRIKANDYGNMLDTVQKIDNMQLRHNVQTAQNELFETILKEYDTANNLNIDFNQKEQTLIQAQETLVKKIAEEDETPWIIKVITKFGVLVIGLRKMLLKMKEKYHKRRSRKK